MGNVDDNIKREQDKIKEELKVKQNKIRVLKVVVKRIDALPAMDKKWVVSQLLELYGSVV